MQETTSELESTSSRLQDTERTLHCTKAVLHQTAAEREEQKHLVEKHLETELKLSQQAKKLLAVSDDSTTDLKLLHEKLDRTRKVEKTNEAVKQDFLETFSSSISEMLERLAGFRSGHTDSCSRFSVEARARFSESQEFLESVTRLLDQMVEQQRAADSRIAGVLAEQRNTEDQWISNQAQIVSSMVSSNNQLVTEFDRTRMSPVLEAIAANLRDKSATLERLEKYVVAAFTALVDSFNAFSAEISANVTAVKDEVTVYTAENRRRMEVVLQQNSSIMQSEQAFKSLLDNMMARYLEHSGLVASSTRRMEEETKESISSGTNLVSSVEDRVKSTHSSKAGFQTRTVEEAEMISSSVATQKTQCMTLIQNIEEQAELVSTHVQSYVTQTQESLAAFEVQSAEQIDKRKQDSSTFVGKWEEELGRSAQQMQQFQRETLEHIERSRARETEHSAAATSSVEQLAGLTEDNCEQLRLRSQEQQDKVRRFLVEQLQRDVPTGSTPGRTERTYPRYLAATSPHHRIIERWV